MIFYRTCTDRDLPRLKHIWLSCFEEQPDAADLFFEKNQSSFHAYACEADGTLVSALYLIDCTLDGDCAHYLCGAATLPAYRGRGIMSSLITYALDDAKQRGDRYSLLFPASGSLYDYYARFGYLSACAAKSALFDADGDTTPCDGAPDLQALQAECSGAGSLRWSDGFLRFAADYYGCYGAETLQSADAYAILRRDDGFAEVDYAVFSDINALKALLNAQGVDRFRLTAAADSPLFEGGLIKPFGMIRSLCGDRPPENVYIGITLQ